jgi:hypothetical protein
MNNCLRGGMNPKFVREERMRGSLLASSPEDLTYSETESERFRRVMPANGMTKQPYILLTNQGKSATTGITVWCDFYAHWIKRLRWTRILRRLDRYSPWRDIQLVICEALNQVFTAWLVVFSNNGSCRCVQSVVESIHSSHRLGYGYSGISSTLLRGSGAWYTQLCTNCIQALLFKNNFPCFGWITYAFKCHVNKLKNKGMPLGNGAYVPTNGEDLSHLDPV